MLFSEQDSSLSILKGGQQRRIWRACCCAAVQPLPGYCRVLLPATTTTKERRATRIMNMCETFSLARVRTEHVRDSPPEDTEACAKPVQSVVFDSFVCRIQADPFLLQSRGSRTMRCLVFAGESVHPNKRFFCWLLRCDKNIISCFTGQIAISSPCSFQEDPGSLFLPNISSSSSVENHNSGPVLYGSLLAPRREDVRALRAQAASIDSILVKKECFLTIYKEAKKKGLLTLTSIISSMAQSIRAA